MHTKNQYFLVPVPNWVSTKVPLTFLTNGTIAIFYLYVHLAVTQLTMTPPPSAGDDADTFDRSLYQTGWKRGSTQYVSESSCDQRGNHQQHHEAPARHSRDNAEGVRRVCGVAKFSSPANIDESDTAPSSVQPPGFVSDTVLTSSSHGKSRTLYVCIYYLIHATVMILTVNINPVGSVNRAAATTGLPVEATPFTLVKWGQMKMTAEKIEECHRAAPRFIVKDLQPFATVQSK